MTTQAERVPYEMRTRYVWGDNWRAPVEETKSLSCLQVCGAVVTLGGSLCAKSHWESSGDEIASFFERVAHGLIAVLEYMPILGGLFALVEKVVLCAYNCLMGPKAVSGPWHLREVDSAQAMQKMIKNTKKALQEHRRVDADPYASIQQVFPGGKLPEKGSDPLTFTVEHHEDQGVRKTMADAWFQLPMAQGLLTGVFDGHTRDGVAKYAAAQLQARFPTALESAQGNVHQAFERLIYAINQEIAQDPALRVDGSTAVISYIDQETQLVYTATLGDSEAILYREIDGVRKAIPLSCIRNFSSKQDYARLRAKYPNDLPPVPRAGAGKDLRSRLYEGVNVARAFGDHDEEVVSGKPKITVCRVQADDRLVLVCDGVTDYVPQREMVDLVQQHNEPHGLAKALVDYALHEKYSRDNITAVVINL